MPEAENEEDHLKEHFQGKRDEADQRIKSRFKLLLWGLSIAAITSFFLRRSSDMQWLCLGALLAWVIHTTWKTQLDVDNLFNEFRYRINDLNKAIGSMQDSLVYIHAEELGFENKYRQIYPWVFLYQFKQAAAGNEPAIFELAEMYRYGRGGAKRSPDKALREYNWLVDNTSGWSQMKARNCMAEMLSQGESSVRERVHPHQHEVVGLGQDVLGYLLRALR